MIFVIISTFTFPFICGALSVAVPFHNSRDTGQFKALMAFLWFSFFLFVLHHLLSRLSCVGLLCVSQTSSVSAVCLTCLNQDLIEEQHFCSVKCQCS